MATATTNLTISIKRLSDGFVLGSGTVTVVDRAHSIDVSLSEIDLVNLPPDFYILKSIISSSPKDGAGRPETNATTLPFNLGGLIEETSINLVVGKKYHCYKDVGTKINPTVSVMVLLLSNEGTTPFAVGTFSYMVSDLVAASRTQEWWIQQFSPLADPGKTPLSTVAGLASYMAAAGFTGLKTCALWPCIETARGIYDTGGYVAFLDTVIGGFHANGIQIGLVITASIPRWTVAAVVAPGVEVDNYPIQGNGYSIVGYQNPDSFTDLENYITFLCNRYYAQGLTRIFTPNEPNLGGQSNQTSAVNALWTKHIKAGIVASGKPIKLVAGEVSSSDRDYIAALLTDPNFIGNYDAFSYHPYASNPPNYVLEKPCNRRPGTDDDSGYSNTPIVFESAPGAADAMVDFIHSYDPTAKVWASETGIASGTDPTIAFCTTIEDQGAELAWVMYQLARAGTEGNVLWGGQTPGDNASESEYGFVFYGDGETGKPAAGTVAQTLYFIKNGFA